MADEIDKAMVIQFQDSVYEAAQQRQSRLSKFASHSMFDGEYAFYDGIGTIEAQEYNSRFPDVVWTQIEHKRRKIIKRRFAITIPMDGIDANSILMDREGKYKNAMVYAMNRVKDALIYEAALATVYTGKDGSTAVTPANDGVFTIDASSGLTIEAILEGQQNWIDAEVGNEAPIPKAMVITGLEHTALMGEIEVISKDYSSQMAFDKAGLSHVMDLEIVKFGAGSSVNKKIVEETDSYRRCLLLAGQAVHVMTAQEFKTEVQPRYDKIDTKQLQIVGVLGAVRTDGLLVQELQTALE